MSNLEDRLRGLPIGRAALDRWSRFQYLPRATRARYAAYAGLGLVVLVFGAWRLTTLGGAGVDDTTLQRAEEVRLQAAVEPPPPTEPPPGQPEYTGPPPKSVKGGGMPPR